MFLAVERLESVQSLRTCVRRSDADGDGHLPSVPRADVMCLEPSGSNADSTSFRFRAATVRMLLCRLTSQTPFMVLVPWGRSHSRMQGTIARVEALTCAVMVIDSSE